MNQHVCEDDGAHAVVERAQGSACPRPRAAAADQQLARASFFLLALGWCVPAMAPAVAQSPLPASPLAAALPRASPRPISWERGWGSAFEEGDRFVAQPRACHAVFRSPWRFRLEASQSFCSKRGWGRIEASSLWPALEASSLCEASSCVTASYVRSCAHGLIEDHPIASSPRFTGAPRVAYCRNREHVHCAVAPRGENR